MASHLITALGDDDRVEGFDCDEPSLSHYLRDLARDHARRGYARTYLAHPEPSGGYPDPLGFYSISMARIQVTELPAELREQLPGFPLPVALLGQLARDRRAPKELGVGRELLLDALERVLEVSNAIGCCGIVLDALNEKLVRYYERFAFIVLPRSAYPRKMFISIDTVRAASVAASFHSPHSG